MTITGPSYVTGTNADFCYEIPDSDGGLPDEIFNDPGGSYPLTHLAELAEDGPHQLRIGSSSGSRTIWIDNINAYANVIVVEPVPDEPAEFDSGLVTFISGLGFITPASQFFFSLILVGIATVAGGVTLKFMAPGRMKLIVVLSVAALTGAFCAILGFFDLWMFLLAIVLAGTIVKGAGEVRNTWREVRETMAQRGEAFQDDGTGIPAAMPTDEFNRLVAADQAKERATQAIELGRSETALEPTRTPPVEGGEA
jgi:hypothetical protein